MGREEKKEMLFWTTEEYKKFSEAVIDKTVSFYAFEMLYWTGMRLGELLALTMEDFDFEKNTVRINKSYQRLQGQDVITTPKTPKSNRTIKLPKRIMMRKNNVLRKYIASLLLFLLFETVAITLWKAKGNLFYLLNFSYIGGCLALETALFTAGKRYARHFVQLTVGSYMLLYLGVISCENMQIEGFWYYLFLGVFEAATIHYAVAKIFGPLFFNPACSLR